MSICLMVLSQFYCEHGLGKMMRLMRTSKAEKGNVLMSTFC